MGAPGCQQRIKGCSVLTAQSLIKQAEMMNSSQAVGFTLETFTLSLPLNYGHLYGQNQGLEKAETIKEQQNAIAFFHYNLS